jgi:hypothetical protein
VAPQFLIARKLKLAATLINATKLMRRCEGSPFLLKNKALKLKLFKVKINSFNAAQKNLIIKPLILCAIPHFLTLILLVISYIM